MLEKLHICAMIRERALPTSLIAGRALHLGAAGWSVIDNGPTEFRYDVAQIDPLDVFCARINRSYLSLALLIPQSSGGQNPTTRVCKTDRQGASLARSVCNSGHATTASFPTSCRKLLFLSRFDRQAASIREEGRQADPSRI